MTEELGIPGGNEKSVRLKRMSGDTPQARVSRYKEERRKQLAGQFANLLRHHDTTSSSSSTSETNCRKATIRICNSNGKKTDTVDEDSRKTKIPQSRTWIRVRCKEDIHPATESKKMINGSVTYDSPSTNSLKSNNRDKSAKRKSLLNRSVNTERATTNNRSLNHHNHSNYSPGGVNGNGLHCDTRNVIPSSLPVPVSSSTASPLSSSSQKPCPSRSSNSLKGTSSIRSNGLRIGSPQSASHGAAQRNSSTDSSFRSFSSKISDQPSENQSITSDSCTTPGSLAQSEEKIHNASIDNLNETCDKTSSDFRLRDVDSVHFEDESLFGDSERKSDITNNAADDVTSSPSSSAAANVKKCRPNSFQVRDEPKGTSVAINEDLLSQKNSLLEIIQTFSEKRNVAAPQNTAVNSNDGSHNCSTKIVESRNVPDLSISSNLPKASSPQNLSLEIIEEDNVSMKPSILKKKFDERSNSLDSPKPNSILKRTDTNGTRTYPSAKASRQGILKKHSLSLDEEEVARSSCSPDVGDFLNKSQEFKPILKSQRRSSFEEIARVRSPELHSILKRSKQPNEETSDSSLSSPHHGILKRKTLVTNGHYDRRSIDSDTVSDTESAMKPILKNKQQSFEVTVYEKMATESPKPILKKKYSETEFDEGKPKKPILKSSSRKSLDETRIPSNRARFVEWQSCDEEREMKSILKKKDGGYRMHMRNVKSDDDTSSRANGRFKRNSFPGFANTTRHCNSFSEDDYESSSREVMRSKGFIFKEERLVDPRKDTARNEPFSTTQNIYKSNGYFEAHYVAHQETTTNNRSSYTYEESINAMESAGNSSDTASSKSEHPDADAKEGSEEKEMINKLRRSNSVSAKASLFQQLARESKKACEEGLLKKKTEADPGRRKLKVKCADLNSRFSTQPVTWDEVAEAKKQNSEIRNKIVDIRNEILQIAENDVTNGYSYLPISERVKLFTKKFEEGESSSSARYRPGSRFSTQPVTKNEVRVAKIDFLSSTTLDAEQVETSSPAKSDEPGDRKSTSKISSSTSVRKERLPPAKGAAGRKEISELSSQSEGDTSSSGGREVQSIISGKRPAAKSPETNSRTGKMNSVISGGTDVVDECPVINGNKSIKQRLAALQQSGQLDWKKRVAKKDVSSPIIKINETQELLKKELQNGFRCKITGGVRMDEKNDNGLADRLEKLETASQTWKKRVEPSDAVQFSVAGKIASTLPSTPTTPKLQPSSPLSERKKRGPCPSRFRSFREQKKENQSEPTSPEKSKSDVTINRSNSLPAEDLEEDNKARVTKSETNTVVTIPQIFDDNFSTFFGHVESVPVSVDLTASDADFSFIKSEAPRLVPTHKKARAQRKHASSGNPLKNMATKIEIKNEYREVKTNTAEREMKRVNVEKVSKHSSLAVEALAGLASKEDFAAVQLKKAVPLSSPMLPYKPLMLLHVKGRRHVQTRLVEPIVDSVNSGDSYVLVTPNDIYHYVGQYANVIERSRGSEIAQHILAAHDLGCSGATQVITIAEDSAKTNPKNTQKFWSVLGAKSEQTSSIKAIPTGHPDEDEVYESSLLSTNMVYEVHEDELVPVEKYWASIPKIQMLDPNKVLVFDFGTELYVWMGKNVDIKLRKSSVKLAKELWENGFNYEECDLCPINSASTIGDRGSSSIVGEKRGAQRPDWCLFAKVTQHMETVLFREKFLDWPDFTRVIRTKEQEENSEKQSSFNFNVTPPNAKEMLDTKISEPDLVLEGNHLGRGTQYFDEERRLFYQVTTTEVKLWHVAEFESEEVPEDSIGSFLSTNSYVIKWVYSISYTGRELTGQPSKHTTLGRDRCVYFYWQGKNASLNEKGAAALLTVELDEEKGIQLRICQGSEPPAFLNLFKGRTIIYRAKRSSSDKDWRLFICRGEIENEASLLEVSCNIRQLRSRASFVLINVTTGTTFVWHGCKVTRNASNVCQMAVNKLTENPPAELGLASDVILSVTEINEGSEPKEFFTGLGSSSRKLYVSLLNDKETYDSTPLLFHLASNNSVFAATPVSSPCHSAKLVTAYPFLQEDLYSANQPALFLLDSGKEIWLWQGWWPEREVTDGVEVLPSTNGEAQNLDKDRGSASIRWQAERRAAMQTVLEYWKLKYGDKPIKAFLVWAGLEPIQFTNLFPDWTDRDDVAEMNILDGKKSGEMLDVEQELERLTQSTYPLEQLLQRPLPEGVDPTRLELYLSSSHFKEIMKMTKEEFTALPSWKQTNLKKHVGLF